MEHDSVGFGTDHEIRNGQRTALGPFTTYYYILLTPNQRPRILRRVRKQPVATAVGPNGKNPPEITV